MFEVLFSLFMFCQTNYCEIEETVKYSAKNEVRMEYVIRSDYICYKVIELKRKDKEESFTVRIETCNILSF